MNKTEPGHNGNLYSKENLYGPDEPELKKLNKRKLRITETYIQRNTFTVLTNQNSNAE